MDMHSFRPSRWLLVCWIGGVTLVALAVGQASAGVCKVTDYPDDRGFALAFGGSWLLGTLCVVAHYLSLRYGLDGHYVSKAAGVLWRHRRSIPLDKVTSIDVRQGPLEQLLRMGQIRIYTPASGSDTPEETLVGVRDPAAVKATILRAAETELQRSAREALQATREVRQLLDGIHRRVTRIEQHLSPTPGAPGDHDADGEPTAPQAGNAEAPPTATATPSADRNTGAP